MTDPYELFGLPPDSDDAAIRQRYLELVKRHPPERDPERFAAIRSAYDQLRDLDTRLVHRLFDPNRHDGLEELIGDIACQSPRPRLSLEKLLSVQRQP